MLHQVDPNQSLDKKNYKETLEALEKKLAALQLALRDAEIPVAVVFEGWGASGKGTCIARVVNPLDPRYFSVRTTGKIDEEMQMHPFLWSFWKHTPAKGRITLFHKGWHRVALPEWADKWRISDSAMAGFYYDVNAFERQLTDGGTLIVKFFLHISKEEQHSRFHDLQKNPDTAWRVGDEDWAQNHHYDHHVHRLNRMLKMTFTPENPWHIIAANDKKYATIAIFQTLIQQIEARLAAPPPADAAPPASHRPILLGVQADMRVAEAQYKSELAHYQQRLQALGHKLYVKRRPVVIVYEGWDAAGKGGNIKRLTGELDPRSYEVVPIAAPTAQELARHYLWRFMTRMPKDGHIAIFDRSWYGRVLVERVEELTAVADWRRAYREINEMEAHLFHHGAILLKFWLHIDPEEQLRRFTARENDPLKQYKITDEDWRNRGKWAEYEQAVDEMLTLTSTPHAPWTIIEANSKKYARLKVQQTVVGALEDALN